MYKIRKIRLCLNHDQKDVLIRYETLYRKQIHEIITFLQSRGSVSYKTIIFYKEIPIRNQWYCYRSAKRLIKGKKDVSELGIALICHPSLITLRKDEVLVQLSDCVDKHTLHIALSESIDVADASIRRVDVSHDEKFWYLNVLLYWK